MSAFQKPLVIEITVVFALLCSAGLSLQMPPQPGRLVIRSEPSGAVIRIDAKEMPQRTDAVFVVSPGQYSVGVSSPDGRLNCGERSVTVSSGQTLTMVCKENSWR